MSEGKHLSVGLIESFNSARPAAFAPFSMATDGLSAAQAARVPGERLNSIWAVTNHLWFWNEAPLRLLRGQAVEPAELGAADWKGWPPAGDPADEAAWQAARARAIEANAAFAAAAAELAPEALAAELPGWGPAWAIVQSMLAHNSYHTGEIMTLRHLQGLWIDSRLT
ncbi:MAG TPA: DinB family protein [Chloroflexaceae bacterium]|nr:DinB family protein [Chloroflexaceae bacterium]